ncbi:hypothetical protein [Microvirga sp. G4-2]|uniref:hypothetical protein n=1 Tax=Microvirga sp. G4-2 TaxID=3434467 RepID=UPI00404479E4
MAAAPLRESEKLTSGDGPSFTEFHRVDRGLGQHRSERTVFNTTSSRSASLNRAFYGGDTKGYTDHLILSEAA